MYFSSMHLLQPLCHLLIQDLTHTFSPFFLFLDLKHSGASRDSQLIVLPKSCFTEFLCDLLSTDSPSLNRFHKQQVCDLSSACDQRFALLKKIVSDLIIVQFAARKYNQCWQDVTGGDYLKPGWRQTLAAVTYPSKLQRLSLLMRTPAWTLPAAGSGGLRCVHGWRPSKLTPLLLSFTPTKI